MCKNNWHFFCFIQFEKKLSIKASDIFFSAFFQFLSSHCAQKETVFQYNNNKYSFTIKFFGFFCYKAQNCSF